MVVTGSGASMRLSIFVFLMVAVIGVVIGQPERAVADRLVVPDSGLFRTVIEVQGEFDLGRTHATGATVIEQIGGPDSIRLTLLADGDQLEALARLGFLPLQVDDLGAIATALQETRSTYASTLSGDIFTSAGPEDLLATVTRDTQSLAAASSLDDDADGLTNTQESWWCTDPLNPNSDGDGILSDGLEVNSLKAWMNNTGTRPGQATSVPFQGWPFNATDCLDSDGDSIPDRAERWDLGLNPGLPSTDLDQYDDALELFGRNKSNQVMPGYVQFPGKHPLAAAYPLPAINVTGVKVTPVGVRTETTGEIESVETTYSTSRTDGTSDAVAETETWNNWQETSATTASSSFFSRLAQSVSACGAVGLINVGTCTEVVLLKNSAELNGIQINNGSSQAGGQSSTGSRKKLFPAKGPSSNIDTTLLEGLSINPSLDFLNSCSPTPGGAVPTTCQSRATGLKLSGTNPNPSLARTCDHCIQFDSDGAVISDVTTSPSPVAGSPASVTVRPQITLSYPKQEFQPTNTKTDGSSKGGAKTITHETYVEQTVLHGSNILTGTEWQTATAVNSGSAGLLRFNYSIVNGGNDLADVIENLRFNVYIGEGEVPELTYSPGIELDDLTNVEPGEAHSAISTAIPLTLAQLRAIDEGSSLRVVIDNYSFGSQETDLLNATQSSLTVAIEDGRDDGDETIDRFIMPIIAAGGSNETVYAILARFFPNTVDANGQLTAIWTPENRPDTPSWCDQPKVVGSGSTRVLWCRHALSTADWWNIYTNGLGTGSEPLEDTQASAGSIALFRFNSDSDLDGYSDRSESQFGTNPKDASSHPGPNLVAGVHNEPVLLADNTAAPNTVVSSTLSLLNLGVYDAYGVEAVMISPDASTTILNNTVGGSGRVKAQKQVIVGSRVALPATLPGNWGNTGHAKPVAGGYFTGATNRTYTFTTSCAGTCTVGQGSWTLNWSNGAGLSDSIQMGAIYKSPTMMDTAEGVKVGLISGTVSNGETFTILATTPADTFQFRVNSSPFTPPLVIVSYNDPQGNHRFVVPPSAMRLSTPSDNLASLGVPVSQMLPDPGVEIVTTAVATLPGSNTSNTKLLVNNPTGTTLTNAKLFLNFINEDGVVVKEYTSNIATLLPGPTYVPMSWNTADFSPAHNPAQDYIVLAFLTDYDGNIIDTGGRPLSSWQIDPVAQAAAGALNWNFETAPQGVLLQHQFALGSTGQRELLAYLNVAAAAGSTCGLGVAGDPSTILAPGDVAYYNVTLDTSGCPDGAFATTIPIRTSDQSAPTQNITVSGTIGGSGFRDVSPTAIHPLDYAAVISGPKNAGEWVEFTHGIGLDPGTLEPVKVYDSTYSTLHGVGEVATDFGTGASSSATLFGDGRNGTLTVSSSSTESPIDSIASGTAGSTSLAATNVLFGSGQWVLIYQTMGTGAGTWMRNTIVSYVPGTITLAQPLNANYVAGAQVRVVPQFTNVTISTGATYSAKPWNGSVGGILAFVANGTVNVSGVLSATGKGFRGGFSVSTNASFTVGNTGEGTFWPSLHQGLPNGNGGGGGGFSNNAPWDNGHGGGGGANDSTNATNGYWSGGGNYAGPGGLVGDPAGSSDLSSAVFGGGGGSGGSGSLWTSEVSGAGGTGGGFVFFASPTLVADGMITSNGSQGNPRVQGKAGAGGSGAGGSILIQVKSATIGSNRVVATGGTRVYNYGPTPGDDDGGSGGNGRIRIESCDPISGTSVPAASIEDLDCFIAEQKPGDSTKTRLQLPALILAATDTTYNIQYGRKATFASVGNFDTTIPVPAGIWDGATIDALISGTPAGAQTLTLDIGTEVPSNPATVVTVPFTGGSPITLSQVDVKAAFNAYYQANPGAGTANVPVRVTLSGAGTVLLTNLEMFPTATILSKIRILAGSYSDARLHLQVGDSGAGPLDITVDVGDNGSSEWSTAGTYTYPAQITTGNIVTGPGGAAGGLNTFLSGKSGDIDVPVRISATPSLSRKITGFTATLSPLPDLDLGAISFGQSNPTEGDTVTVSVPITNTGSTAGGTSVTFFGISPDFGRIYLGSNFLPSVGSSGNASIQWKTLGFTGSTSVEAVIDHYGDVQESNENNNSSTNTVNIATRPDLKVEATPATVPAVTLSIPQPVTQDLVSVTVIVKNAGQAAAGASTVSLFDGDPSNGGVQIGTANIGALAPNAWTTAVIPWTTPAVPGPRLLVVRVDSTGQVSEGDEGNNDLIFPAYIGFRGPILINSGAGVVADPSYDPARGWGFKERGDPDQTATCGSGEDPTIRLDTTGTVDGGIEYRFDNLQPGRFYHLDLVMHECDFDIGRIQAVEVNDVDVATGIDLSGQQVVKLSLLLDPASYAQNSITVRVHETSGVGVGAILNHISIYDIDYRYADSGSGSAATDPVYPSEGPKPYGSVVGEINVSSLWGTLPHQTARQNTANTLTYRFDGLQASKSYRVNATFYHGTQARVLQLQVDDVPQGSAVSVPVATKVVTSILVPNSTYSGDGSILVNIVRTDGSVLPVINEISLEEVTQSAGAPPPSTCYTLTTAPNPPAGGNVTRNVQPSCEGDTKYPASTPVQLTAVPVTDYVLDSWSSGLGTVNPITVTMDADKSITASFARCYALTATATAGGAVNVQTPTTPGCPSGEFKAGTLVNVLATPNTNFSFDGWTGDAVAAQNLLQIVMSTDRAVTANFIPGVTCFGLTATAGAGGSVSVQPPPDCPTDSGKYASSTTVTLTATPNPGFSFTGWTGSTQSGLNPLLVLMSSARNYTAQFAQCYSLSTSVTGNGTLSPSPKPNCDNNTKYVSGTQVQLAATASANNVFDSWSGDVQGGTTPTVVTMSGNKSVTANFLQCFSLGTGASPGGSGSVFPQTTANCPGGKFKAGTSVSLLAVAAGGFFFQSWGGDAGGGANPTSVVMNADRSVTALFTAIAPCYSLSVTSGSGGSAAATPGPTCLGEYNAGTEVELTASPNPGFVFKEWTGTTTTQDNPLNIITDGDKSYTAHFVRCYSIAVSAAPGGSGEIGRSPSPNCPGNNGKYVEGTTVTLTPQPASGWSFLDWSGGSASGAANPLSVIANADKTIVANFVAAGDSVDHPVEMTSHSFSFGLDAANATKDATDPVLVSGQACAFSERLEHSVWMSFTAPRRGTLWVSTAGSGFDTVLAIFSDSPSGTNQVGCNDNTPGETTSFLSVTTLPGTTYWIEFGSWLPTSVGMLQVQADWFASTDINCSHGTDAFDALEVLRILAGLSLAPPACPADADGNAMTDLGDALYVRQWIAGLLPGSEEGLLLHASSDMPPPLSSSLGTLLGRITGIVVASGLDRRR